MVNRNITYVPTSRGWKPVSTQLLEGKLTPVDLGATPAARVKPRGVSRISEVADSPPPTANKTPPSSRMVAEDRIRAGYRERVIGVVDSNALLSDKLKKIEVILTELDEDLVALRRGDKPTPRAATESFVRKLRGEREKPSAAAVKDTVRRLLGRREFNRRLQEAKQ